MSLFGPFWAGQPLGPDLVRSDPLPVHSSTGGGGSPKPKLVQNPIWKRSETLFKRLKIKRRFILILKNFILGPKLGKRFGKGPREVRSDPFPHVMR